MYNPPVGLTQAQAPRPEKYAPKNGQWGGAGAIWRQLEQILANVKGTDGGGASAKGRALKLRKNKNKKVVSCLTKLWNKRGRKGEKSLGRSWVRLGLGFRFGWVLRAVGFTTVRFLVENGKWGVFPKG